ncbi:transglutaminase-like domain-containing protein [Roseivivax isoporae]|uniref:Transglutaminase n=1 Tax=Roseivivax isoporae LMG 25204 TaxID=1449351 RepID=X7F3U1_9RHOB|nr:transglutaminase-like domain-containing protein [Roseivivax isoporae]ETX26729.1 transglutaminase [Roseivivax isoporae LMG 25204]
MTDRRTFLGMGVAAAALAAWPRGARAALDPRPGDWRQFRITTDVTLAPGAEAQVWLPVPSVDEPGWMRAGEAAWTGNADEAEFMVDPVHGARFLRARWGASEAADRTLSLDAGVATRDRATDFGVVREVAPLAPSARALYTAPTDLIPTDGIVAETAARITAGLEGDADKARAIYDWIVENTARNPETRGCGLGDVASMLAMGDLTGKCADLNALFVGLARAADLPARDVYGIRVAPSSFGYKSLGAGSPDVTKAQHCRAEVWLEAHGWVPADPADVRKVMLEEPPGDLGLDDPKVAAARAALFGAWEGNWVGYNFAHDVALPGARQDPVPFLMYPQAEIGGEALDPLAPDTFRYAITARAL